MMASKLALLLALFLPLNGAFMMLPCGNFKHFALMPSSRHAPGIDMVLMRGREGVPLAGKQSSSQAQPLVRLFVAIVDMPFVVWETAFCMASIATHEDRKQIHAQEESSPVFKFLPLWHASHTPNARTSRIVFKHAPGRFRPRYYTSPFD